jgi:ribonucleoside-diphosphate reductase alpha chain
LFHTQFAKSIYEARYKHPNDGSWHGTAARVVGSVMQALPTAPTDATHRVLHLMDRKMFLPGGRYLYAAGRDLHQVNNCILLNVQDSREGWSELSYKAEMALMTGAGIGVWYGNLRAAGTPISRTGGEASGPLGKMKMINDIGRYVMQGGARRSAIWAGLPWWHPDVFDFITCKDYSDEVKALKAKDWTFPAPMDTTNISVTLDDAFFCAFENKWDAGVFSFTDTHGPDAPDGGRWMHWARRVYEVATEHMFRHGEPGFTIDRGDKSDEVLRNACTEITSADDSDVCNLGSLVLPRFSTPQQFGSAVRDAVLFLTAGSVYSDVPYDEVSEVRDRNRRLGLGLIGVHEFLMRNGVRYGTDEALEVLEPYMDEYARALEHAWDWQDKMGLSRSKGATAIAPNGTIGIIAESTPSADPLFSAAERREVKVANVHGPDRFESHVVVDPVARRLVQEGVDPDLIEDAYTLSYDPDRRLRQQAFLQRYVDHAISGTVNLPEPLAGDDAQSMGRTLMDYLGDLRGVTFYPNGARAGQPRTPVPLEWALDNEGVSEFTDDSTCSGGVCGV